MDKNINSGIKYRQWGKKEIVEKEIVENSGKSEKI